MEKEAIESFIAVYISIHDQNHFSSNTLEETLNENLAVPLRFRKLIALYFHNSDDAFSYTFCSIFSDEDIKSLIDSSYDIVGWDISYEAYHNDLVAVLDKYVKYPLGKVLIQAKTACLLILQPFNDSLNVYRTFLGSTSVLEIKTALRQSRDEFNHLLKSGNSLRDENSIQRIRPANNCVTENELGNVNLCSEIKVNKSNNPVEGVVKCQVRGNYALPKNSTSENLQTSSHATACSTDYASGSSTNCSLFDTLKINKSNNPVEEADKSQIRDNDALQTNLQTSSDATPRSSTNCSLFDANEFQQTMLNMLGDRDYDCFEYDEHIHLKNKIGYAKYGPPQQEDGYNEKQQIEIEKTFLKIVQENNKYAKWVNQVILSFIYNCLEPLEKEKLERKKKYENYDAYSDVMPVPLFVIKKCYGSSNPCRIFIDSNNRIYKSWKSYIKMNKLHKCMMVLPINGKYSADSKGIVILERHLSPACGTGEKILRSADTISSVAGIGSAVVFGVSMIPAIAVAPVALAAATAVGIGATGYSVSRSIMNIYDKSVHGEDLSFENSEARGAYLSILAGSLGFVGAGATGALSYCASNGIRVGEGAMLAVNTINVTNIGIAAGNIGNTTYQVINDWVNENRKPSWLTIVQLSSSILFFGNAVYNFRTATNIIDDAQTNTLRDYSDSLRSNRHRKMFNKMTKETIRQHGGDSATGQAEVISSLKNIQNKDETFAILTRNNKLFNKHGIRFSSEGGQIKLNGMSVDLSEFGGMTRNQRTTLLLDLPTKPPPSMVQVSRSMARISNILQSIKKSAWNLNNYSFNGTVVEMVTIILNDFAEVTKKQLIEIAMILLSEIKLLNIDFAKYFQYLNVPEFVIVLRIVIKFFKYELNNYEIDYQKAKTIAKSRPGFDEKSFNAQWGFCGVTPDDAMRATRWFQRSVTDSFSDGIGRKMLEDLMKFFISELSTKIMESINAEAKDTKRRQHSVERKNTVKCELCKGYYYC